MSGPATNAGAGTAERIALDELKTGDLIKRVAGGDAEALRLLSARYRKVVFSVVSRVVGDRAAAERVVLAVFEQIRRQPGAFPTSRGAFLTRLVGVARDLALEERRKREHAGDGRPKGTP